MSARIVLFIAAEVRTLTSPGLHRMLEAQNGVFVIGMALAFASRKDGRSAESDDLPSQLDFIRGLSVISSSSNKSDWDGYIIPR